eukprot:6181619-Pleurochrysis_carterae.AAC.2
MGSCKIQFSCGSDTSRPEQRNGMIDGDDFDGGCATETVIFARSSSKFADRDARAFSLVYTANPYMLTVQPQSFSHQRPGLKD